MDTDKHMKYTKLVSSFCFYPCLFACIHGYKWLYPT